MEVGDSTSGVAKQGGGPSFKKKNYRGITLLSLPREGLCQDDVVLLASSSQDLQHVLGWRFAAECEAAGMRISTSKSEATVLGRKRVACPLWVGGEILPQGEELKYLEKVLFRSEGKMEREIDRRLDWCSLRSYAVQSVYRTIM
ncbi:hypothetical protein L3Q82_026885 [Scortum barcoo]|uniref:Uncharacterized protein n=1 Tax=Scortum barcoo TaxID=214431 RepID=A0ACB8WK10_9TELE|nr:hypothetical protein L3Q82_026885 [Scortum barcoo]